MNRAIAVVLATLLLLAVGFFMGRRPVSRLAAEVDSVRAENRIRIGELEARASLAEARGYLWQARARLLMAAIAVERSNFGTASEHASEARDLLTRAASAPDLHLDLTEVQGKVEAAVERIHALDTGARGALEQAAAALGQILDRENA